MRLASITREAVNTPMPENEKTPVNTGVWQVLTGSNPGQKWVLLSFFSARAVVNHAFPVDISSLRLAYIILDLVKLAGKAPQFIRFHLAFLSDQPQTVDNRALRAPAL
jgi:hypothetical protein